PAAVSSKCKGNDVLRRGGIAKVVREGARERFLLAPDAEDDSAAAVTARAQRVPSVRGAPSAMSAWPRSLGCMPVSMAPPMPVLAGIPGRPFISPGRSPGFAAAPAGASPSNAVHQSDRQLDGCALPEKVEENLHPPAPGAGPLHRVVFLARLAAGHVPVAILNARIRKRRESGHEASGRLQFQCHESAPCAAEVPDFSALLYCKAPLESALLSHPCSPRSGALLA